MNGFQPDRPQRMAQMLAMQERNRSLNAPSGQRDGMPAMRPSMAYSGATPNTASGMPPQAQNFTGPINTPQPGTTGFSGYGPMPRRSPQLGGVSYPRKPSSAGLTTPQGGRYRGDFDDGQD